MPEVDTRPLVDTCECVTASLFSPPPTVRPGVDSAGAGAGGVARSIVQGLLMTPPRVVVPPAVLRSTSMENSPSRSRAVGMRWRRGNAIGRGSFGEVYLGMNDDTGAIMAVKELQFSLDDKREIHNMQSEINLMRWRSLLMCTCVSVSVSVCDFLGLRMCAGSSSPRLIVPWHLLFALLPLCV